MYNHKNEIQLDDTIWIKYIEDGANLKDGINIDIYLKELFPFLEKLESICVAGCCGLDAYDFTIENIKKSLRDENLDDLTCKISKTIVKVGELNTEIVASDRLNQYMFKNALITLLNHIIFQIKQVAQQGDAPKPAINAIIASQSLIRRPGDL